MGVVGLCWCLGVLLMLANLDARNVKLVPAGTKTVSTNGATHEITRYILVPDDQTSGPSADTVTDDKTQYQVTNKELSESEKNELKKQPVDVNSEVDSEMIIKNEKDIKTVKAPDIAKYNFVLGAHPDNNNHQTVHKITANVLEKLLKMKNDAQGSAEHSKVDMKVIPLHQESKMNVYLSGQNSEEKEHSNLSNDALKLYHQHTDRSASKASEAVFELYENEDSSKAKTEPQHRRTEIEDHTLTEKTAGDRNSWRGTKTIYNPPKITNIELRELLKKWDYAEAVSNETGNRPLLETIGINKTFTLPGKRGRFKLIHEDDGDDYNDDINNVLEKPLLKQSTSQSTSQSKTRYYKNEKNSGQNDDTTPVLKKTNLDTNIENSNTKGDMELTLKKSNTNINPAQSSIIEFSKTRSGNTNVEVTNSHSDSSIKKENKGSRSTTTVSKSIALDTNKKPAFDNTIEIMKPVANANAKTLKNASQNKLKVLPVNSQYDIDIANSSQVARNNTINTTNTKTTIVTQDTYVVPSTDSGIKSFENQSKVVNPRSDSHNINIKPRTGKTNIISKFENNNVNKNYPTVTKNMRENEEPKLDVNSLVVTRPAQIDEIDANKDSEVKTKLNSVNLSIFSPKYKDVAKSSIDNNSQIPQNKITITSEENGNIDIATQTENILSVKKVHIPDQANSIINDPSMNNLLMPLFADTELIFENNKKTDHEPSIALNPEKHIKTDAREYSNPDTISGPKNNGVIPNSTPNHANKAQSNITDSSLKFKHKIVIVSEVDNASANIAPKTENNKNIKNFQIQEKPNTFIDEPNKDNVSKFHYVDLSTPSEPQYKKTNISELSQPNILSNFPQYTIKPKLEHSDASTNFSPKTNTKNNGIQYTPEATIKPVDKHDYFRNNMKPINQIILPLNLMSETNLTDVNNNPGKHNTNVLSTKAKITSKNETDENPMNFELLKNVSEREAMTSGEDSYDRIEYEALPQLKTDIDSVYEDYPYADDDGRSSRLTYREEITNNQPTNPSNSQNNDVKIYPNAGHLNNKHYYNTPGARYPVHPYSYIQNNPYQDSNGYNSQSNKANLLRFRNTDVIDSQYLIYILNYLLNIMTELNQQYAAAGQWVDRSEVRKAFIIKHLQNLGIHKFSSEQLQFLTQQIHHHETVNTSKITNRKIERMYDIEDNKPNAPLEKVVVSNPYYYLPYNKLYTGVADHNVRLLNDNVYLQYYLLDGSDVSSVSSAVGELCTRILNIVTYLRSLRIPDAEIIQFIVEAKKYLSTEILKSVVSECQSRAYIGISQKIDMIAKQVLHKPNPSQDPMRYWYQYPRLHYH